MTEKRFIFLDGFSLRYTCICDNQKGHRTNGVLKQDEVLELLNHLHEENEQLKKGLKRCKDWINSDKYDYELTLSFIKNKGYSLKDVLEYEKKRK